MSEKKVDAFIKAAAEFGTPRSKARYGEFRGRRDKEIELWNRWHEGGRQEDDLVPLLKSMEPMIKSETNKRMQGLGGSIPQAAMHNELRNATVKAIQSYDPNKGTQLSTHVNNNFQRVTDFVAANRNPKYMPKADVGKWGVYTNARQEFVDEHGREPTALELQQKLPQWSEKGIKKMQHGFGAEAFTDFGADIPSAAEMPTPRDAVILMRPQFSPQEWEFASKHYPMPGETQMSVKQIAKNMGIKEHKAYRIKTLVEKKIAPVLKKE